MASLDERIDRRVRAFVAELQSLIQQAAMQAVREALDVRRFGRPRTAPAPNRAAVRRRAPSAGRLSGSKGRRSADQMNLVITRLEEAVRKSPGMRMEQIGATLHATTKTLARPMSKLLASGAVRRTGQKRGANTSPRDGRAAVTGESVAVVRGPRPL